MAQLKMYWVKGTPIKEMTLPEGYSFSLNKGDEADMLAWIECCKNGLVGDDATLENYERSIKNRTNCKHTEDVFFLDYDGKHIATITAIYHPEENCGEVHMVGMIPEFRGKGLGKYLNNKAIEKLNAQNVDYIYLTTDEWRKGAVKSYLSADFKPVEYDEGMTERWQAVITEYGIDSVDMVNEDAVYVKRIYRDGVTQPEE